MATLITFNSRGLLEPAGPIRLTLTELHDYFVTSSRRQLLFDGFVNYLNEMRTICQTPLTYWINGSFVTKKVNPGDVDFCVFIDYSLFITHEEQLVKFGCQNKEQLGAIDAFIIHRYPLDDPKLKITEADSKYWMAQWTKTRPNKNRKSYPKGFIELIY